MSLSINPTYLDDDDLDNNVRALMAERERRDAEREAQQAAQKAAEPKVKHRFRHTVNMYGHFYTEAYDAYEADTEATNMTHAEILERVNFVDSEVNDDELPEDHGPV